MHRPRVKPVDVSAAGVPLALRNSDDPVWATPESTLDFLDTLGLEIPKQALEIGPASRCRAAGRAWAWSVGLTRAVSWGKGTDLDLPRMRELGLSAGTAGGDAQRERLRHLNPM